MTDKGLTLEYTITLTAQDVWDEDIDDYEDYGNRYGDNEDIEVEITSDFPEAIDIPDKYIEDIVEEEVTKNNGFFNKVKGAGSKVLKFMGFK